MEILSHPTYSTSSLSTPTIKVADARISMAAANDMLVRAINDTKGTDNGKFLAYYGISFPHKVEVMSNPQSVSLIPDLHASEQIRAMTAATSAMVAATASMRHATASNPDQILGKLAQVESLVDVTVDLQMSIIDESLRMTELPSVDTRASIRMTENFISMQSTPRSLTSSATDAQSRCPTIDMSTQGSRKPRDDSTASCSVFPRLTQVKPLGRLFGGKTAVDRNPDAVAEFVARAHDSTTADPRTPSGSQHISSILRQSLTTDAMTTLSIHVTAEAHRYSTTDVYSLGLDELVQAMTRAFRRASFAADMRKTFRDIAIYKNEGAEEFVQRYRNAERHSLSCDGGMSNANRLEHFLKAISTRADAMQHVLEAAYIGKYKFYDYSDASENAQRVFLEYAASQAVMAACTTGQKRGDEARGWRRNRGERRTSALTTTSRREHPIDLTTGPRGDETADHEMSDDDGIELGCNAGMPIDLGVGSTSKGVTTLVYGARAGRAFRRFWDNTVDNYVKGCVHCAVLRKSIDQVTNHTASNCELRKGAVAAAEPYCQFCCRTGHDTADHRGIPKPNTFVDAI